MNISDPASATEKRDAAYEIKFVIPIAVADTVLGWARTHLAPDPNAEPTSGDGYRVNSLYFDTRQLDVYRRNGSYGKSKYRVRRYGSGESIFLERKLKSGGLVTKRRTRIPDEELARLADGDAPAEWIGYWFRRRLLARQLLPQCQIRYDRVARLSMTAEGPIRLTIDRDVRALRTADYNVQESGAWVPLLPDRCILELKFRLAMPDLFKSLLQEVSLTPQAVSKYRLYVQGFGLDPVQQNGQYVHGNGHASREALLGTHPPYAAQPAVSSGEA